MIDLVRKRHDGDGWIVFEELGDKPGLMRNRTADALALSVWASGKYEAHLYEFKISREDLKKELRDPTKVEAVGKYCAYWWLAVSDEKILNELIVPEVWGIVTKKPHGDKGEFRLHTLRKAPRQKPKDIGVHFAISMIRNMAKGWVSKADHGIVKEQLAAALDARSLPVPPDVRDKEMEIHRLERRVADLERGIKSFEEASGVTLGLHHWDYGHIGKAVKQALTLRERFETGSLKSDIAYLSNAARELELRAQQIAEAAVTLRDLGGEEMSTCARPCRKIRTEWNLGDGPCTCGAQPLSEVERKLDASARAFAPQDDPASVGES